MTTTIAMAPRTPKITPTMIAAVGSLLCSSSLGVSNVAVGYTTAVVLDGTKDFWWLVVVSVGTAGMCLSLESVWIVEAVDTGGV